MRGRWELESRFCTSYVLHHGRISSTWPGSGLPGSLARSKDQNWAFRWRGGYHGAPNAEFLTLYLVASAADRGAASHLYIRNQFSHFRQGAAPSGITMYGYGLCISPPFTISYLSDNSPVFSGHDRISPFSLDYFFIGRATAKWTVVSYYSLPGFGWTIASLMYRPFLLNQPSMPSPLFGFSV